MSERCRDHVEIIGVTPEGEAVVKRTRGDHVEIARARPAEEGKPLMGGELVKVKPCEKAGVYDAETVYKDQGAA